MKATMTITVDIPDDYEYEDYRDAAWEIFTSNLDEYYLSDKVEYDVVPERKETYCRPMSLYERNRAAVYATGNKWAIENWEATH